MHEQKISKLRLCIVVQSLIVGGSSQVVYNLIKNWSSLDYIELSLIVFFDQIDSRYDDILHLSNVKTFFLHKKATIDLRFMKRLKKTIKLINPDIISTHLTCVFYLNFFVNYKKCIVFHTIHAAPCDDLPAIYRNLIKKNIKKGNIRLICCHQSLVPHAEKIYNTKVFFVNNGIEIPKKVERNAKIYDLLIVGRMVPIKRFDTFLYIVESLKKAGLEIKAAICGYGPEKNSILDLKHRLNLDDNVDCYDEKNDVKELYKKSKILVMCSLTEGSPIVILEANSFAIPVVATNVGSIPTMIIEGINGYTYPINDITTAVKIIYSILSNPKKLNELEKTSYEESKKHTDKKMAEQYLDLFLKIRNEKACKE